MVVETIELHGSMAPTARSSCT